MGFLGLAFLADKLGDPLLGSAGTSWFSSLDRGKKEGREGEVACLAAMGVVVFRSASVGSLCCSGSRIRSGSWRRGWEQKWMEYTFTPGWPSPVATPCPLCLGNCRVPGWVGDPTGNSSVHTLFQNASLSGPGLLCVSRILGPSLSSPPSPYTPGCRDGRRWPHVPGNCKASTQASDPHWFSHITALHNQVRWWVVRRVTVG